MSQAVCLGQGRDNDCRYGSETHEIEANVSTTYLLLPLCIFSSVVMGEPSASTNPMLSYYSRTGHQHSLLIHYKLSSLHWINDAGNSISLNYFKPRNLLTSLAFPTSTPHLCSS